MRQQTRPTRDPVHSFEIAAAGTAGHLVTYSDGQFAGDRDVIRAVRAHLTADHPSVTEVEATGRAIAARRQENFVPCDCEICVIIVEEVRS
jgi:hypothetical protein